MLTALPNWPRRYSRRWELIDAVAPVEVDR